MNQRVEILLEKKQNILTKPAKSLCPWDFQARVLEWVAISFYKGSSDPRIESMSLESPALPGAVLST